MGTFLLVSLLVCSSILGGLLHNSRLGSQLLNYSIDAVPGLLVGYILFQGLVCYPIVPVVMGEVIGLGFVYMVYLHVRHGT